MFYLLSCDENSLISISIETKRRGDDSFFHFAFNANELIQIESYLGLFSCVVESDLLHGEG